MRVNWYYIVLGLILWSCDAKVVKESSSSVVETNHRIERTYFDDNVSIETEVPFVNDEKHGLAKQYYRDGTLRLEINYENGLKHGFSKQYYRDGKLYQYTEYEYGKIEGIRKKYHQNGNLMAEIPYHNGQSCLGLKEYLVNGEPRQNYPEVTVSNRKKDAFTFIEIMIGEGARKVSFYEGKPAENGCFNPGKSKEITSHTRNKLEFSIPPDSNLKEVNIMIKMYTLQRNPYWVYKKIKI